MDENFTKIAIVKSSKYKYGVVFDSVSRCIDLLGGIKKFVKQGDKVLIKPNLLSAKPPGAAVTTHPLVVQSVCEIVQSVGGEVIIGDSPAIGRWNRIIKITGMEEVAKKVGAKLVHFDDGKQIDKNENGIYKNLEISKVISDVDVVINLPKLKTHVQMFLTLGVKNLYGCIIGKKKVKFHMEAGNNPLYFAERLIEVYKAVNPSLTIVDGIESMEGNGPGSGDVKHTGLIVGGVDCIAIDRVITEVVGAKKYSLYTTRAAKKKGVGESSLSKIDIVGEQIQDIKIDNFILPEITGLEFGSGIMRGMIKKLITSKPIEDRKKCKLCDYCIRVCPPGIITKNKNRLNFNYDKCIRCYCCIEVCPHAAMKIKHGYLVKLLGLR